MPYVPPGSALTAGPLPVIPRSIKTKSQPSPSIAHPTTRPICPSNGGLDPNQHDDVSTPKAISENTSPVPPNTLKNVTDSETDLASQLDSISLETGDDGSSSSPPRSLSSPASTSILSLYGQSTNTSKSTSTSSSSISSTSMSDDGGENEGDKDAKTSTTATSPGSFGGGLGGGTDPINRYREELYAYTHSLYIQAKLSSSRAERRRQSVSLQGQFGSRTSGMEKMAAKKALAKHLNG
ncbi:hypothetical protein IAR55_007165 [Kwoniella newhampshirensis]|uniref:Uncharacterized protein n=1 Tax=Kwoniella newhampshirensis TaxID=1651941 RepID=A0AAW0YTD1_9TREE